ncbi:hypothetical protein OL229_04265 [Neisseriaceae bacterium JH1-16]|nr:hypothetical protein [Neisseriaceae bacterium JH1-16]
MSLTTFEPASTIDVTYTYDNAGQVTQMRQVDKNLYGKPGEEKLFNYQ